MEREVINMYNYNMMIMNLTSKKVKMENKKQELRDVLISIKYKGNMQLQKELSYKYASNQVAVQNYIELLNNSIQRMCIMVHEYIGIEMNYFYEQVKIDDYELVKADIKVYTISKIFEDKLDKIKNLLFGIIEEA